MKIKDLPPRLQAIAWERYKFYRELYKYSIEPNAEVNDFLWSDTKEGHKFWTMINNGNIPKKWQETAFEIY